MVKGVCTHMITKDNTDEMGICESTNSHTPITLFDFKVSQESVIAKNSNMVLWKL